MIRFPFPYEMGKEAPETCIHKNMVLLYILVWLVNTVQRTMLQNNFFYMYKIHKDGSYEKFILPLQWVPFPWNPDLHWQIYLVVRFTQVALIWQLWSNAQKLVPRKQKIISVNIAKMFQWVSKTFKSVQICLGHICAV